MKPRMTGLALAVAWSFVFSVALASDPAMAGTGRKKDSVQDIVPWRGDSLEEYSRNVVMLELDRIGNDYLELQLGEVWTEGGALVGGFGLKIWNENRVSWFRKVSRGFWSLDGQRLVDQLVSGKSYYRFSSVEGHEGTAFATIRLMTETFGGRLRSFLDHFVSMLVRYRREGNGHISEGGVQKLDVLIALAREALKQVDATYFVIAPDGSKMEIVASKSPYAAYANAALIELRRAFAEGRCKAPTTFQPYEDFPFDLRESFERLTKEALETPSADLNEVAARSVRDAELFGERVQLLRDEWAELIRSEDLNRFTFDYGDRAPINPIASRLLGLLEVVQYTSRNLRDVAIGDQDLMHRLITGVRSGRLCPK